MYVQSVKEKQQKKTIINSNTSYRREMKFFLNTSGVDEESIIIHISNT